MFIPYGNVNLLTFKDRQGCLIHTSFIGTYVHDVCIHVYLLRCVSGVKGGQKIHEWSVCVYVLR